MSDLQPSYAWYALRRTLPSWRFEELLSELVEQLPKYRIDEVIIMLDTEEFFPGPPNASMAQAHAAHLRRAKAALGEIGVAYSLNPWVTRGHEDRSRRAEQTIPGIQTVIHSDGSQASCVACTLCPAWRSNLRETWRIYASTEPRVLWIEDDIRSFGAHECFCPLHLDRFYQCTGQRVSREDLVTAMRRPGEPHPLRKPWIDFYGMISLEVMELIASIAKAASPDTKLGLMSSSPRNHCREGRDWTKVAKALGSSADSPIFSRPTMGNYWEWGPPRGLYYSQDSIKLTRHVLPAETIDQSELESVPFSRYSKSVAFTSAHLAISFAYGCRGTTLNIFDHLGSPMEAEPHYGRMLRAQKAFLNAVAEKAQQPGVFKGIGLIHRPNVSAVKHLTEGAPLDQLADDGYPALEAFEAAGIPTTYDPSDVVFLTGQQPRCLSDTEIEQLLQRGLFLDGPAAAVLCQRGYADKIGLSTIEAPKPLRQLGVFSAEEFFNDQFGGKERLYMSAHLPMADYGAMLAEFQAVPSASIVSAMVNPESQRTHPCMIAFENTLGGRVVVHAWDYAAAIGPIGVSYHSPTRQQQLQHLVRWLFRGSPPLLANGDGAWPLVLRKDCKNETLIGFFNLSLDDWPGVNIELSRSGALVSIQQLSAQGIWTQLDRSSVKISASSVHVSIQDRISLSHPLIISLKWETTNS